MSLSAEQVVLEILAYDIATPKLTNIKKQLEDICNLGADVANKISNIPSAPTSQNGVNTPNPAIPQNTKNTKELNNEIDKTTEKTKKYGKIGSSTFHEIDTMLSSTASSLENIGIAIAGVFGANSFKDMITKMWEGASERQSNMLYLIHQKGVDEANAYYNEIMDIVTQLPGDDTFLTNILNMAAGMDDSIKLDNLKELGSAITDLSIASQMKGENSYEIQTGIRKYVASGNTKPLNDSILAGEIDTLKDKNTILERTKALQDALNKTGFEGMSGYDSAINELEELRGHFQKAFADIGQIILFITQPLMDLYNTLDTIFGGGISQSIIILATSIIGVISVLVLSLGAINLFGRGLTALIGSFEIFSSIILYAGESGGLLNSVLWELIGTKNAETIAVEGNIIAGLEEIYVNTKRTVASYLNVQANASEEISLWSLVTATFSKVKAEMLEIASKIKTIIFGYEKIIVENAEIEAGSILCTLFHTEAELEAYNSIIKHESILKRIKSTIQTNLETIAKKLNISTSKEEIFVRLKSLLSLNPQTNAIWRNTIAQTRNALSTLKSIGSTVKLITVTIIKTIHTWLTSEATFSEALAENVSTMSKINGTNATIGLATATALLESTLAPIILPILLIVGALVSLVVIIEKVGEAFGWWTDFGSMFEAISAGVNRLWNAFMNSNVVQEVIAYFSKFVQSIQYVWDSLKVFYSLLFGGGEDNGTFDIVQSLIDVFGAVGDAIGWVWDIIDDIMSSDIGVMITTIIFLLNPLLGIILTLIFHLDEIGSIFEDIGDAINKFMDTSDFMELQEVFGELWNALVEPFQEVWGLLSEIVGEIGSLLTGIFGDGGDPAGRGTEDRVNFIVELLKGLATLIKVVIVPIIYGLIVPIKIIAGVMRVIYELGKLFGGVLSGAISPVVAFYSLINVVKIVLDGIWDVVRKTPLGMVIEAALPHLRKLVDFLTMIWNIGKAITKSFVGKLFGWDKTDDDNPKPNKNNPINDNLYAKQKGALNDTVWAKSGILTADNVNTVRTLGSSYNNVDNQKHIVVNQNFNEGSIPVDARNMTSKDARKMFVGAFGYNRAVGSNGILR